MSEAFIRVEENKEKIIEEEIAEKEEQALLEKTKLEREAREKQTRDKLLQDAASMTQKLLSGKIVLGQPFMSGGRDVKELHYNFRAVTGMEMCEALDSDPNAMNVFKITSRQALALFAKAVEKCESDVDARDVKRGLSGADAFSAIKLGTIFFNLSNQATKNSITTE